MVKQECPHVAAAMGDRISTWTEQFPVRQAELNPCVATMKADCSSSRYRRQSAQIKEGQEARKQQDLASGEIGHS